MPAEDTPQKKIESLNIVLDYNAYIDFSMEQSKTLHISTYLALVFVHGCCVCKLTSRMARGVTGGVMGVWTYYSYMSKYGVIKQLDEGGGGLKRGEQEEVTRLDGPGHVIVGLVDRVAWERFAA